MQEISYPYEKYHFYELAAKRFKAELRLSGAVAAVHLENKNDEVFWGKMFHHVYPNKKIRFIASSRNTNGNITCGCSQCLQYRPFLSKNFLIAIDSDYRYLTQENGIDAKHHILQTYTYSFENHFCYAKNVDNAIRKACHDDVDYTKGFSFQNFLLEYSHIIYPLLVWQLYLEDVDPLIFPKHVFHRLLTLPNGGHSIERNGKSVLQILKQRTHKMLTHFRRQFPDADVTWYEARCHDLGVRPDNAYLFVRGHQLYDCINMEGRKIYSLWKRDKPEFASQGSFESFLTHSLCYDEYDEIKKVEADIRIALELETSSESGSSVAKDAFAIPSNQNSNTNGNNTSRL